MSPSGPLTIKVDTMRFCIGKVTFHCYIEPKWSKMVFGITFMADEGVLAVQAGKLIMGVYW